MNIVILGMHRSGTSVVTKALKKMGFYLGEDADLISSQSDNPEGFWERYDVVALNDSILSASGCSWVNPVGFDISDIGESALVQFDARAQSILAELEANGPWAMKDPRMCITWSFWQRHIKDNLFLYIHRSPESVAHSLNTRNGFPLRFGEALWEIYSSFAINILVKQSSLFIDHRSIVTDSGAVFERIYNFCVDKGVSLQDLFNRSEVAAVWNPSLIHESQEHKAEKSRLIELMSCVDARGRGDFSSRVPDITDKSLELMQELSECLEKSTLVADATRELAEIERDRDKLYSHYKNLEAEHLNLANALQNRDAEFNSLSVFLEQLQSDLRKTQEDYSALDLQFHEVSSKLGGASEEVKMLTAKSDYLFYNLEQTYRRILLFRRSNLGRIIFTLLRLYRLSTLRRKKPTELEVLLLEAMEHFSLYGGEPERSAKGRLSLAFQVFQYAIQHPYSTVRSFSFFRLKRLLNVLATGSESDAVNWIEGRFPAEPLNVSKPDISPPQESFDSLELEFPIVETPKISIVVPVYNQYRMTISCLKALLAHSEGVSYEVLLADDCSSDLTESIATRVKGIKVIRNESNLGFLKNCNHAAKSAQGKYILLLNNDTNVQPGWLVALYDLMERDSSIGLAGPKLLFDDGVLQEAGGIIWSDASGWNYGRGQNPEYPEYNYVRETDYISGACVMIPMVVWNQLGGFDEYYRPAYYEDTDFAFKVRKAGLKVIYQPKSVVVHFEGVSHGSDPSQGIKKHQVVNQKKFYKKWKDVLARDHYQNAENVFAARDKSKDKLTVVVIDHYVPHFDKDAGSRSTYLYLKLMTEMGINVKFIGANFFPHQHYTESLEQLGIEVLYGERYARTWKEWLQENAFDIDAIYIHRPHIAEQFLEGIASINPKPKVIYFGHDLHYIRTERQAELENSVELAREARTWRKREYDVFDQVDLIYYPSESEVKEISANRADLNVKAIPLYVLDAPEPQVYDHKTRSGLLFVGGFGHPPNADAVKWFVNDVLPIILQKDPAIQFHVVGSNVPDEVLLLASQNIVIHGYLSDIELQSLYAKIKIVVVPLRYGAGVKGKVLEALSQGVPVVTTDVGAEGIPDAKLVMKIVNDAADFAKTVLACCNSYESCQKLLESIPAHINKHYSESAVRSVIYDDFYPKGSRDKIDCG